MERTGLRGPRDNLEFDFHWTCRTYHDHKLQRVMCEYNLVFLRLSSTMAQNCCAVDKCRLRTAPDGPSPRLRQGQAICLSALPVRTRLAVSSPLLGGDATCSSPVRSLGWIMPASWQADVWILTYWPPGVAPAPWRSADRCDAAGRSLVDRTSNQASCRFGNTGTSRGTTLRS
jgi:hypothetical protein